MNEKIDKKKNEKDYPCEWCQGLGPFRRKRCPICKKLFCKYHIDDHECEPNYKIQVIFKGNCNTLGKSHPEGYTKDELIQELDYFLNENLVKSIKFKKEG